MKMEKIKIRDLRRKEKYQLDDEYLNGYARLCGVFATAVYNSLCRHADKLQECYPSIELIMEQHGFGSKHTVIKAIKKLEEWGIIAVRREKDEKTKRQLKNVYVLRDKSDWKQKPGALNALGAGCISCTEPSAFHAQKPSAPDALEGYTEEKDTHEKESDEINSSVQSEKFNFEEYLDKMFDDPKEHINLIAFFFREKGLKFDTKEKVRAAIKRHTRSAREITKAFKEEEVAKAMQKCIKYHNDVDWSLETVMKKLTN